MPRARISDYLYRLRGSLASTAATLNYKLPELFIAAIMNLSVGGGSVTELPTKLPPIVKPVATIQAPKIVQQHPLEPVAPPNPCGDNPYKQFIYQHESGCSTTSVNSIGCRGLGQACPGSKLPCGDDWYCQDAWFNDYAQRAYGGWANAAAFWQSHRWW